MLQEKLKQNDKELRQLDSHIEQDQSSAQEVPDLGQLQAQQQVASSEEEVSLTAPKPLPQHNPQSAQEVSEHGPFT